MRKAKIKRVTKETEIVVNVNLDGVGNFKGNTGIKFLDHMISSLSTHSLIDIFIEAKGDLNHHTTEDLAICLGKSIKKALEKERNIIRFGYAIVPMDCSLAISSIDLVDRPYLKLNLNLQGNKIEDMNCEDINHFIESLAMNLCANLHIWIEYGQNDHHKVEAAFKALALSLRKAITVDKRRKNIPSSKGAVMQ